MFRSFCRYFISEPVIQGVVLAPARGWSSANAHQAESSALQECEAEDTPRPVAEGDRADDPTRDDGGTGSLRDPERRA